jgi:hypothetical protein
MKESTRAPFDSSTSISGKRTNSRAPTTLALRSGPSALGHARSGPELPHRTDRRPSTRQPLYLEKGLAARRRRGHGGGGPRDRLAAPRPAGRSRARTQARAAPAAGWPSLPDARRTGARHDLLPRGRESERGAR